MALSPTVEQLHGVSRISHDELQAPEECGRTVVARWSCDMTSDSPSSRDVPSEDGRCVMRKNTFPLRRTAGDVTWATVTPQEMQRLEEKQVEARRLLEEKVEKVSQQLAQVPERRTLLEAPVQRSQDMLAVSLESASDEAARHRAKAAEEWSYAERHAAWYSLLCVVPTAAALENAELVKLSHHLGRQFHQRLQEPVHVDFGEVLREVKKTHSAVSSDFRMVLGEIGKIQQALHLDFARTPGSHPGFHPARVRPMKDFRALVPFAVAILFIVVYFTAAGVRMGRGMDAFTRAQRVLLVRFEDTLVAPPTQRVTRDISVVRLPRLYFCPADRYRHDRLIWNSYDCSLNYKTESDKCSARIQHFGGEEPETFKHGANWSSACLEFGTHKIGVKQEWSAAWNEISLKAAFLLPAHGDTKDVFQEIELGYLPKEWEVGEAPSTIEHYYAPLIRVPIFQPPLDSHASDGIATRMYLAEQEDHGRHEAGDFWYVYGASSMPVVNATMPEYRFFEKDGEWVRAPKSRRALAHIVITLEDFTKYEQLGSLRFVCLMLFGSFCFAGWDGHVPEIGGEAEYMIYYNFSLYTSCTCIVYVYELCIVVLYFYVLVL
ncbi:unnamed protein product [Durusdinium trenchii]|uniref:Uncharacterized protein n=1 Tax=Durusdinium trenchii TaxID=1381693 RepID=A0ABP0QQ19_9DINO